MRQFLVHAKHEAHFASSHADVAGGHVGVGTDVAAQLQHEGLTESHHLGVALAARREVATALAATHGERGEGVFECLFKSKELQNAEVHGTVEANASFVGTNAVVVLHAIAHVRLHFPFVVHPVHAELIDAVGNAEAFDEFRLLKFGVFVVLFFNGSKNLLHSLMILRLVGETSFNFVQNFLSFHVFCFMG